MLDPKFVRENPEVVRQAARKKRVDVDVDALLALDGERRELSARTDAARAEQNTASKSIGRLAPDQRAAAAEQVRALKEQVRELEDRLRQLDERFRQQLLRLPNPPAPEVPEGAS